jgi:uncharacterized protein (TIGR02996 family)
MADFPALEVVSVTGSGPARGARFPLENGKLVIGREGEGLAILDSQVSPRHCEVVFEYGRWWVRDLGSHFGTFFAGGRVHDAELQHGDTFVLGYTVAFRLLLREPLARIEPHFEEAIVEAPDDADRWSVYADWLQERGDPLGARIADPRPEDDLRWLGALSVLAARRELEVTFAHGLPSTVVLRSLFGREPRFVWDQRLAGLITEPLFRFVRHLEIDAASLVPDADPLRWGEEALRLLGDTHLPLLERLVIGPCTPAPVEPLRARLDARRAKFPRFQTTPTTLVRTWRPATLERAGERIALAPSGTLIGREGVLSGGTDLVGSMFELVFREERWVLTASEEDVRVNGMGVWRARLRPGDEVWFSGSDVVMKFNA